MAEYKNPYHNDDWKAKKPTEMTFTKEDLALMQLSAYKEGYRDGYRDGHKDA